MTNNHGLDEYYFKLKLEIITEGIHNYSPQELARALTRIAMTADEACVIECIKGAK